MTLKDIKLTEDQQKELKDKLDSWKAAERKKIEEQLTERYEQMEAQLKEESEELVEEVKENMKKVYAKRFQKALREMYKQIKAEVMVESLQSPEAKALEEVKAVVYPLINEGTAKRHRDEFSKLAEMYDSVLEEHEMLKGRLKKAQLVESLSPEVRKVVNKLLGEGTVEEIVDRFADIKKALKEEMSASEEVDLDGGETVDEDIHIRSQIQENDDNNDYARNLEEDNNRRRPARREKKDNEFEAMLHEQLALAGLRKAK
jgi:G:T/U-mismatch repair DNA glycosylase